MAFILISFATSSFGDQLYKKGDYFRAITEYKRDLFFKRDSLNAIYKVAMSYFKLGRYDEALQWISRAYYKNPRYELEYEYLLTKLKKFEEAKILLSLGDTDKKKERLKNLIDVVQKEQNYWKASYVIPGSGQILSGEIRNGITSFVLNSAAAYILYQRVKKKDVTGSLFSAFYFLGFYRGNIQAAQKAEQKRRKKEFQNKISNIEGEYLYYKD
jgi:tetratricopeptide (TPR) repeat protein